MGMMDRETVLLAEHLRDVADRLERGVVTRCFVMSDNGPGHTVKAQMSGLGYDPDALVGSVVLAMKHGAAA